MRKIEREGGKYGSTVRHDASRLWDKTHRLFSWETAFLFKADATISRKCPASIGISHHCKHKKTPPMALKYIRSAESEKYHSDIN